VGKRITGVVRERKRKGDFNGTFLALKLEEVAKNQEQADFRSWKCQDNGLSLKF
jgi:hypothetical protein